MENTLLVSKDGRELNTQYGPMHFVAFKDVLLHYVLLFFGDAFASCRVAHHLIDQDGMNDFARHKMMIYSRY
jgi:hypothetical protein